ncbi:CheR-type MCP methyltransferase [Fictibacillus macauensis ZFHKF-1]|uniref:CheR-type MCP methyltransferase n=1 Tax=Fictibacillus macauensis ZFHKF-1 TaxID=1196324 RepID=I8AHN7_9BACL|nr:class I SAM-dependent methyltransferase [Fictibacillus macauensis]EIT85242.1 CheR-type MCP methyltransferase [Fictibacillus macauensis ZFHKF-1]
MSYEQFAYVYDELMEDVPYDEWLSFFEKETKDHEISSVLDLGCGTGAMSLRLAQKGYHVTGVDLSEDMLVIAQEKAMRQKVSLHFLQQDMTKLEGLPTFDAAVIFCDSLNYILEEEAVLRTFVGIHRHLKEGGMLLFDVHSLYKMEHVFLQQTFGSLDEHVPFIWQCFAGELPHSIEHELSFFVEEDNGLYRRFDELHKQRSLAPETYVQLLEQAGFTVRKQLGGPHGEPIGEESERLFFVCSK